MDEYLRTGGQAGQRAAGRDVVYMIQTFGADE